jgi:hypothetical protein
MKCSITWFVRRLFVALMLDEMCYTTYLCFIDHLFAACSVLIHNATYGNMLAVLSYPMLRSLWAIFLLNCLPAFIVRCADLAQGWSVSCFQLQYCPELKETTWLTAFNLQPYAICLCWLFCGINHLRKSPCLNLKSDQSVSFSTFFFDLFVCFLVLLV